MSRSASDDCVPSMCARRLDDGTKRWIGDGHRGRLEAFRRDGHREGASRAPCAMAIPGRRSGAGVRSLEADERLGDAENGVSVDEVLLAPGGVAQGGGGNAIDLAQGPLRMLVERRERVIGEDGAVAAGSVEPESNVLGRVLDGGGGGQEAM